MKTELDNVLEARKSAKSHIEFFEKLLEHLKGTDKTLRARAVWATWCLHRYINDCLITDVNNAILMHSTKEGDSVQ